jgi:hypothetical protein
MHKLADSHTCSELVVFEALWALTNILSGDSHYVRRMIAEGCLPPVQQHMLSKSPRVAEQATWAIANVFGACAAYMRL